MIQDDAAGASPTSLVFSGETVDSGISDFVGSAPSTFNADSAVSERPLTATEAATATTNGRPIAYVPFAATPVAIVTLVPTIPSTRPAHHRPPSAVCPAHPVVRRRPGSHVRPGRATLPPGAIRGFPARRPRVSPATPSPLGQPRPDHGEPGLDGGSGQRSDGQGVLRRRAPAGASSECGDKTSDTPSEHWPYAANTYPRGDQSLIEHMVNIDPRSNVPTTDTSFWHLGAIAPDLVDLDRIAPGRGPGTSPPRRYRTPPVPTSPLRSAAAAGGGESTDLSPDNIVTFNPTPQTPPPTTTT